MLGGGATRLYQKRFPEVGRPGCLLLKNNVHRLKAFCIVLEGIPSARLKTEGRTITLNF
jgi:hypothetical protein